MGELSMQSSMNDPVLVPVILEALVVGKDGIMADYVPDYSLLRNSQAFGNAIENGYFTTKPMEAGVHLHWTVPDALLTGVESGDGRLVFPQLPNRWILFRFAHRQDGVETCCFMIESDYVTNSATEREWKKTTLPTFCLRNGQWEGAGQKGELFGYVGEAWEYGKPRPGQGGYYLDQFTAVESGDPAFAAYYPGCSTMLGFCDRLSGQSDSLSLTYLVAGYYADTDKDPLAGKTLEQLIQMGFELKDAAAQVSAAGDGMLCHGMLTHVVWNGADASYENGVPKENIEVYVGDTSAEALAALMQQEMPEVSGMERMARILQYNLMGRLEDPSDEDALIQVEELLHEKKFQPEPGGICWNVCKEDENDAVELTQQELEVLRQQNCREKQIEQEEKTLSSLVQEAYSMAWKYICICNDPFLNVVSDTGDEMILREKISAEEYRQKAKLLLSKAKELSARLEEEKKERERFCTEQTEYFKAKKLKLCAQQAQRYYMATPPALLLAGDGVRRSFKQGCQKAANGMLPCRKNPIRQLTVKDGGQTLQISGVKLSEITGIRALNLPEPIQGLAEECLLLDADNVELLAGSLWEKTLPDRTDLVRKAQQEALAGESAPYGPANHSYSPVWNPLFMDWEVDIAPAGAPGQEKTPAAQGRQDAAMQEFVLGEIDLETDRECSWEQEKVTIQGNCMILPHAVDNLGNMIEQLIKDCGEEEEYADLKAAAARLKDRDILSQQLDGFPEALVMLNKRHCFPIMKEPDDPGFNTLAEGLNSLLFPDFCAKSPRIEKTKVHFLPLRAGIMRINKLRIIGSFGQVKNIKLEPERIHIAEDLRCKVLHAALLRPRFPQPCRVDLTWLAPDSGTPIIEQWENPVIGYLIPDFPDKNIQIFDPQGTLLGMIQVVPEGVKWMPLPWKMTRPEDWQKRELRTFVLAVLKEPVRVRELLACMEQGFDLMAGNKNIRAVCFGNVLALVRAGISVEMSGNPCTVQDWGTDGDSAGYEEERFAVGIGDERKRQDGVMGYFGSGQSGIDYETFYFCRGKTQGHYAVAQDTLTLSLKSHEAEVILMMDPYKEVTLRTGFLPAWSKKLPIQGFREDIGKLEGLLRMMPILENPQNFGFLTPAGEEGWSFIHAQGQETKMFTDLKEATDGIDERSVTVMEGFLTVGEEVKNGHKF